MPRIVALSEFMRIITQVNILLEMIFINLLYFLKYEMVLKKTGGLVK